MDHSVFITRTGAFLPFEPVSNDEIEDVLGRVGGKDSRAKKIVLRRNGIESRHYAIDRATGKQALSNAQVSAEAIRSLGDVGKVDCLCAGTSTPDSMHVGHADLVHAELRWPRMEVVSFSGICLSSTAALKRAYLAVGTGDAKRAVTVGSEVVSPLLTSEHFQPEIEAKLQELEARPEIAFEKDFLRWMLSDGSGAVLLENEPLGPNPLRIEWIELSSAAHILPACMYSGAEKDESGEIQGWATYTPEQRAALSIFSIKQDVRLLNENVVTFTFAEPLSEIKERRNLKAEDVDWFLPHLSSQYFFDPVAKKMEEMDFSIPREKWFTNLFQKGNTGSASPFIMLDEFFQSGKIKRGETILMFIPESGRFSGGFVYLTAA